MADFHIGDTVQIVSPKARVERMAVFAITEFKEWEGELCATGDGHAWWPVAMLDYALSPEQRELLVRYERAVQAYNEAERNLDAMDVEVQEKLPESLIDSVNGAS